MAAFVANKIRGSRISAVPDADNHGAEQADIDSSSWTEFLSRLQRYVGARVEPGARDDVVGDILLRIVQHQEKVVAARNPMAWVTRVAANAVIDHTRRRASEHRAMAAYAIESDEIDIGVSTENSPSNEIAKCIAPLIESLPKPYREALRLVEIDGLSRKEAAERLGLSLSGMKSRIQRGRTKLKQSILGCCAIQVDRRGEILAYRPRLSGLAAKCHCTTESPGTR